MLAVARGPSDCLQDGWSGVERNQIAQSVGVVSLNHVQKPLSGPGIYSCHHGFQMLRTLRSGHQHIVRPSKAGSTVDRGALATVKLERLYVSNTRPLIGSLRLCSMSTSLQSTSFSTRPTMTTWSTPPEHEILKSTSIQASPCDFRRIDAVVGPSLPRCSARGLS